MESQSIKVTLKFLSNFFGKKTSSVSPCYLANIKKIMKSDDLKENCTVLLLDIKILIFFYNYQNPTNSYVLER